MRTYVGSIAFSLALLAGAPAANAQLLVEQRPVETIIVEPSATIVQAQPAPVRRHVVVNRAPVRRVVTTYPRPLYDVVAAPVVQTVPAPVVVTPASTQVLNVSGQFRCVEGCAAALAGPAFITQNGWDLTLVNEVGQPSRAWIDRPGHIWVQNWNEGAIYSADGMTIQFDNGAVWRRELAMLVVPSPPVQ